MTSPTLSPSRRSALRAAAFLMATSAIGPGFLTQTAAFTNIHGPDMAFAILASVLIDIGVQWNVWRVIGVSGQSGPNIASAIHPFLGALLRVLVVFGGFVFNVGNLAGCALGLSIFGVPQPLGAVLSALLALTLLARPRAMKPVDYFVQWLGFLMLALTATIMFMSHPDYVEAARRALRPSEIPTGSILTLVGGTVGGYITFSGAHRLLASGLSGRDAASEFDRAAITGILVTALMRTVLFLAILGVLAGGTQSLDPANPAGAAFRLGGGVLGEKFFGVVFWSAAITSVVGCSYTSLSFVRGAEEGLLRSAFLAFFIVAALAVFLGVGRPAQLLVWAGGLNGLILPLSLGVILVASRRVAVVGNYKHPLQMTIAGGLAWLASVAIAGFGIVDLLNRL
ncbi:MAG: divalent metal cation transporter [Vicinamibacteria bacterium]|nr:divalent metal cation transporter [Vicinamibacteria bacterium]